MVIFDIDNDPDSPQLSLKDGQELLKGKTFMMVKSKSHQIDKDKSEGHILRVVDRYRIIVSMNANLTNDSD